MSGHGTPTRYRAGCRCDACRVAQAVYNRRMRIGSCCVCGREAWTNDRWSEGRCVRCSNRDRTGRARL